VFKRPIVLFCVFFFVASFGTLMLKVHVQNLALDVKNMRVEKNKLTNEVQVLKAEWSYLNNADRVSGLARQYLGLDRVNTRQVRYINQENVETPEIISKVSGDIRQVNTDWRYKSRMGILKISNKKSSNE